MAGSYHIEWQKTVSWFDWWLHGWIKIHHAVRYLKYTSIKLILKFWNKLLKTRVRRYIKQGTQALVTQLSWPALCGTEDTSQSSRGHPSSQQFACTAEAQPRVWWSRAKPAPLKEGRAETGGIRPNASRSVEWFQRFTYQRLAVFAPRDEENVPGLMQRRERWDPSPLAQKVPTATAEPCSTQAQENLPPQVSS